MDRLLATLRAAAEPTRLRLLALVMRGPFCVSEFTAILGQSQPRLSRHLKLLCEAGLLERSREGARAWFTLPAGQAGTFVRAILAELPNDDPLLQADRRKVARVLAERARIASESFTRQGADWDEMRALGLPATKVSDALLALLPEANLGRLIDIGTGTGGALALFAPKIAEGLGIDASQAMLALARTRLSREGLGHCAVRRADMYRLPLPDGGFDVAILQMVLHYAEDPAEVLAEATRVLTPEGRLVVVDLARHRRKEAAERLAHRWHGFSDDEMTGFLTAAGLVAKPTTTIPGPMPIRLWPAARICSH